MAPDTDFSEAGTARESELARAAAAGDGHAFASLYQSYEKRIYNYCLRILGGTSDAEDATQEAFLKVFDRLSDLDPGQLNFGAYLFTAARNSSYDMIERRRRTEPVADLPDDGSGHLHRERADADIEPERAAMLSNQQAAVRAANERLPVRQREVLALREVEGMSYAQIASTMEMNSNSVAQLISRARTSLRSELHLGVASAVPPASADCERAMPLLAMRQDSELGDPAERAWLDSHLSGCSGCRLSSEELAEAGISYRAWVPVAPALYLFRDTLAKASEAIGADWSQVQRPSGEPAGSGAAAPGTAATGWRAATRGRAATTLSVAVLVALGTGLLASEVADSTIDPAGFPASSATSAPASERDVGGRAEGAGDGRGRSDGAQGGSAAVPDDPTPDQDPLPPASATDPSPFPADAGPDTSSPTTPAPPRGATPDSDTPGGDPSGGGGAPVTPPTPSDPPRDPKQPSDPPATGPPVITTPTKPDPPTKPTPPPSGTPGIKG